MNNAKILLIVVAGLSITLCSDATDYTLVNDTSERLTVNLHSPEDCTGAKYELKPGDSQKQMIHISFWGGFSHRPGECCATTLDLFYGPENSFHEHIDINGKICKNTTITLKGDKGPCTKLNDKGICTAYDKNTFMIKSVVT